MANQPSNGTRRTGTTGAAPVERLVQAFDHWDPELAVDPFPVYEALRERCPVAHTERHDGYVVLSRFADIEAAARDPKTFSSLSISIPKVDLGDLKAPPLDMDPPEHTRLRRLLLPFFSPGRTNKLEPLTRAAARGLIEQFRSDRQVDIAEAYAKPLPIAVLAQLLGVEPSDEPLFSEWTNAIVSGGAADPEAAGRASADIRAYLADLLDERRRQPRDDLLTYLVEAQLGEERLPPREQLGVAALLLIAGIDTTWSMLGTSLWFLAQDSEARGRLVEEPDLLGTAVEELLRLFAPVSVCRITTRAVTVGGQAIPERTPVLLPFPSANHDDRAFPDPDAVQLDRAPNRHLGFGAGVHRCIGAHLARMELRVGLEEFLKAFADFRLAGDGAVEWRPGPIRGPKRLELALA